MDGERRSEVKNEEAFLEKMPYIPLTLRVSVEVCARVDATT